MKRFAGMVFGLLALAAPVQGQTLTNAQADATATFVLNNVRHTMLHEIGHLFVDQLELPVLGKEEDAVDAMATLLMLETGLDSDVVGLEDTVEGWLYSERVRPLRGYFNADFYGAHSLDIQRSFAIACLMVGSDFERHTRFASRISMPVDRQQSCAEDYGLAAQGWETVLAPHRRTTEPVGRIRVFYRDALGLYEDEKALLEQARVLEHYADWVAKTYVLPSRVRMTAEVCGEVNAFYDPGTREVILCYEWVEFFHDMFVSEIMPVREHFALMRELKLDKIGRAQ